MNLKISRSTIFVIAMFLFVLVVVPALLYIGAQIGVLGGGADGGTVMGEDNGERRIVMDTPIVYANNTILPIGIHTTNLDDTNHTVSMTMRNNGTTLWKHTYQIRPHKELEIRNLIDKRGVYMLEVKLENGDAETQKIYFDFDHDYILINIEDGTVNVTQSLSTQ